MEVPIPKTMHSIQALNIAFIIQFATYGLNPRINLQVEPLKQSEVT